MTEVAFHFNAPDPVAYTCRLLRKAVSSGAKLVVVGSPDTLQQLDVGLWTFSATDFVPHCYIDSDPNILATSPVVLATTTASVPHQQVLINLGHSVPDGFELFERVIEVVGLGDDDRQLARSRWKSYTDCGYTITRHDLNLKST
ncbi:MAG: DNA polymerase III subunit chi [Rhodoferax sp.]|uniref:DNA polymerase III subunit chi n=1 Tax=Rhodoferax sp. TaxID=50421 RepID=UPI003016F051